MEYAPIKAIKLINFRNLREVVISFDDNAMITVVGDNEAGKSSMSKSMETIGANLNPNIQKDYIMTGSPGFMIAIALDDADDTVVFRKKAQGFNGFGIQKKGQVVWSTDKMDENVVPPQIKEYMGFILETETKELLNVRTYENLLLFITTSGSSNYKVMYNALKADNLAKAIKSGTAESNEYKSEIRKAESNIEAFTEKLRNIRLSDLSPLLILKQRLENEQQSLTEMEEAKSLLDRIMQVNNELGELNKLNSIDLVNETEVETLNRLYDSINDLKSIEKNLVMYKDIETCEQIDVDELNMLQTCKNILADIECKNYEAYNESLSVEIVNENELQLLSNMESLISSINKIDKDYLIYNNKGLEGVTDSDLNIINQIEAGIREVTRLYTIEMNMGLVDNAINTLEDQLKSFGVLVTTCRNCGDTVIMEP